MNFLSFLGKFQVRQQHLDRSLEFLCDELQVCDRKEANEHRIFFISAREALVSRNNHRRSTFDEGKTRQTIHLKIIGSSLGYKERLVEFNKFEYEFEKCLSKSAVQTKFEQHLNRAREILNTLHQTLFNVLNQSDRREQDVRNQVQQFEERHRFLEENILSSNQLVRDRIRFISENVYQRVAQTLNDEVRR